MRLCGLARRAAGALALAAALAGPVPAGAEDDLGRRVHAMLGGGDVAGAMAAIEALPARELDLPWATDGGTLLHALAARASQLPAGRLVPVIELLVDRGATVDRRDDKGRSALFLAGAHTDSTAVLDALLRLGADPALADHNGRTALFHYAATGNVASVQRLIAHGASPDRVVGAGNTPLIKAIAEQHGDVVDLLLDAGASVNAQNRIGRGAIHAAAERGDLARVEHLVDIGADIDLADRDGATALSIFASRSKWAAVRRLIERGANPRVPMRRAASIAAYLALNPELGLADLVELRAADLLARTRRETSALSSALGSANIAHLRVAAALGVDLSQSGKRGYPPVVMLSGLHPSKHPDVLAALELVIEHGADVNARRKGKTGLSIAVEHRRPDIVRLLLDHGADPRRHQHHRALVDQAMSAGNYEMAGWLLEAGATLDLTRPGAWKHIAELAARIELGDERRGSLESATRLLRTLVERSPQVDPDKPGGVEITKILAEMSTSPSRAVADAAASVAVSGAPPPRSARPSFARDYPREARLHVIGVYEGEVPGQEDPMQCLQSLRTMSPAELEACLTRVRAEAHRPRERQDGTVVVHIRTAEPVVLGLMAYESVNWVVANHAGARIDGVLLGGYHAQRIEGIDETVPIDVYTHEESQCGRCQVGQGHLVGQKRRDPAVRRLALIAGRRIGSFQGANRAGDFTIPAR